MKKTLFLLISIVSLASCKKESSEIDQSKIFQNYTMIYNEETNKTTVSATFYEDKLAGKNLELSATSSITMNGNAMTKNGTTYATTVDGNLANATLVFTDNDGNKFTNTISKSNFIANQQSTELENGLSAYWYWLGNGLANEETIQLTFVNVADQTKSAFFEEKIVGKTYLTLPATNLSTLPTGSTSVEIKRIKTISTGNFASVGGKISSTYVGLKNFVQIY